jgi:hypothetical protein
MYNLFMFLYTAVLFYVLTPGVLLSLPPKSSKMVVAATHAFVFALVYKFTHRMAWKLSMSFEGFQENKANGPNGNPLLRNMNTTNMPKMVMPEAK